MRSMRDTDIKRSKDSFKICMSIFIICVVLLSFLFAYLVGQHYHFEQWTEGEKRAFIILFTLGGFLCLFTCFFWYKYKSSVDSTSTLNGGNVAPQLIELYEMVYPNSNFNFNRLKTEVQNLKSKELKPQLETKQTQLINLIVKLKNKVNNDTRQTIDFYLQSHAQMIAQNKEGDNFAQGQLTNFEDALQNHLTQEELRTLRTLQKETLVLEKNLNNLQGNRSRIQIEEEPIARLANLYV